MFLDSVYVHDSSIDHIMAQLFFQHVCSLLFAVAKNTVFGSKITGYDPVVNRPSCNTERSATCFLVSRTGSSSMQNNPCFACINCPGEYDSISYISVPFFVTFIASICPTRSFTEISGVARTYLNRSLPDIHSIGVSSLLSRIFFILSEST